MLLFWNMLIMGVAGLNNNNELIKEQNQNQNMFWIETI